MPWYIRLLCGVELGLYAIFFTGLLGGSSLLVSTKPSETARRASARHFRIDWHI